MIRIKWDQEEMVALVDLYFQCLHCNSIKRNRLIHELSLKLNRRAELLNIPHDNYFRNHNGISMMLMNLKSIATDGAEGLSSTSELMVDTWRLYHNRPEKFHSILNAFNQKYGEVASETEATPQKNGAITMPEKNLSLPLKEKVAMPSSPNESAGERLQSITKSANKIGYTLNAYLVHNNIPQLAKLADYLGCNEEDWVAFRIEDLNLSVRSLNCLRGKASTVAELLKLKVYNIANAKGMGVKSFEEIIDVLRKLVEGTSDRESDLAYSNNAAFALNQDLLQYRDAIISGHWDKIATQELGIECTQQIDQLKDAYEYTLQVCNAIVRR